MVQRAQWKTTPHAVRTTSPKHKYAWIWSPNLSVNVAGIIIPAHDVHKQSVSVGTKGNKLWASYTLMWVLGEEVRPESVVIESGPILGPKEAKLSSTGKDGHTEQQIGQEILEALETLLSAPTEHELEAVIVEIHQTNTPCSGPGGCALYLEREIMDTINRDTRVPTLILRASATQLYESQIVPTYPGHGSMKSQDREILPDWDEYGLEGEAVVVHNKAWQ